MAEVASAYVSLVPSARDFGRGLQSEISGDVEKAGKSSGRKFGVAALAGVAVVAGGAAMAGKALYGVGATFDDVSDTIRVGTGATGKALEALNQSAKNIGRDIPASFEDVGATVADLNTRLGLTGPTLETVSKQFLEAGRITGQALDVKTVTGALSAFNVKGAETSKAMDDLYRVSQATGVGINELAASVAKGAPQLQQFGFSFRDSAALLGTLDKAGLDSRATMMALSRGMIQFAKDGKKPKQALQDTVSQIQTFTKKGQDAAALKLASKIFGTRGAGQFVQAVKSGSVNLKDLMKATGATSDTILGAGKDTADFAEQWQLFKNRALLALEPVATRVFGILGQGMEWINTTGVPALKSLSDKFRPVIDTFKLFVGAFTGQGADVELPWMNTVIDIASSLRGVFDAVVPSVRAVFASFQSGGTGATMAANAFRVIGQVLTTVGAFIRAQVLPALLGIIGAIRGYVAVALPIVQQFVAGMMARIQPMLPTIRGIFSSIGQIVVGVMGLIQAIISRVTAIVGGIWSRWGSSIMNFAAKIFGSVLTIIGGALRVIQGIIKTVTSIIRGDWSGAWSGIKQIVSGAWQAIKGIVSGALTALGGIIRGAGTLLKGAMTWVGTKINEALTALKDKMLGIGGDIVNGLAQGIRNAAGRVAQAAHDLAMKIPEPIRKALGIHSPSKVTKQFGAWVGQGLAIGMTGTSKQVAAASAKLAANISGPLERRVSDEVKALKRLAGQREAVAAKLKAARSKLADALKVRDDYAKSVRESFSSFGQITGLEGGSKGMIATLTQRVQTAKRFKADLAKLQKMGLSKAAYKQIVDAGPEQGSAAARALVEGGTGDVKKVNSLLGQLQSAGNAVASTASKALYQAGVDSARGLVKGLQSQSSALAAAAKRIADSLVRQVKKSLGIKSPSRVFAKEVGAHIPTGVIRGIDSTQGQLTARLSKLASPKRLGVPAPVLGGGPSSGLSQSDINRLASAFAQVQIRTTVAAGSFDSAMAVGL